MQVQNISHTKLLWLKNNSDTFLFWHQTILTSFDSDTKKVSHKIILTQKQFRHLFVLTQNNSDIFWLRHLFVLTPFGSDTKTILTQKLFWHKNSDSFLFWHKTIPAPFCSDTKQFRHHFVLTQNNSGTIWHRIILTQNNMQPPGIEPSTSWFKSRVLALWATAAWQCPATYPLHHSYQLRRGVENSHFRGVRGGWNCIFKIIK